MFIEDGKVIFGEWLPDQPALENAGLVEARNCLPVDSSYTEFGSVNTSDDALADPPTGAYATVDDAGDPEIYAGTTDALYEKVGSSWTDRTPASPYTSGANDYWRFVQFDNYVIATNYADVPQKKVVGESADFEDLAETGDAPRARQVGVINRFVFLGDIDDGTDVLPFASQWCAIDDVTNWPVPATSTARSVQSGREVHNSVYGPVTAYSYGQFWGLIFQKRAITRATYVGGDRVFQFETFEQNRGCWAPQSMIQVGGLCYFLAHDGWCVTDGQSVIPIGDGKIDRWFYSRVDQTRLAEITSGVDWTNKCILWNFPDSGATDTATNFILALNFQTKRFSYAEVSVQLLLQSYSEAMTLEGLDALYSSIDTMSISFDSPTWQGGTPMAMCFESDKLGNLSGEPLDALFETGETAPNPFGYTFIRGARPLVTGQPSSITMQIGYRNNQDESRSYTNQVARFTRTGVCDFLLNGRFLSARINVSGGFDRATGLGVDSEISDQV
jgi:hypothetical protein